VKYYLDAHRLRVLSFFERTVGDYPAEISPADGRAQAILEIVRPGDRVAEVGCGKGRFLRLINEQIPGVRSTGIDPSPAMLAAAPQGIERVLGSLESIPCPDASFDVVFSVEAIEHAANPEAAVEEMVRVVRPGGWVVVIDKQQSQWGRLACPPWERWPESDRLRRLMNKGCDQVDCVPVSYDGQPADGLLVAWRGRRRSALTGPQWNVVCLNLASEEQVVGSVRAGRLSPWAKEIVLATAPGERVLEVGSGTGELSLALARSGRQVTLVDISPERLEFARRCAAALGVSIQAFCGDATRPFPWFGPGEFDCVFSSGLLEHFDREDRIAILRECARVSRDRVLMLVPNAACLAYRIGKAEQEAAGTWPYGLELPIFSLREDFEAAGLRVSGEHSVGGRHAIEFIPADHPARAVIERWVGTRPEEELREWNQGYLLVTLGTKAPAPTMGSPP
jgi:ubiquinone/menaquinone biosynthesis C-methylase UbiE